MSEALKKQLIEECKRLDASYDPPVNHSIDEIRSDLKLIKSIHQKKRKTERIEKVRTDEVYAAEERKKIGSASIRVVVMKRMWLKNKKK